MLAIDFLLDDEVNGHDYRSVTAINDSKGWEKLEATRQRELMASFWQEHVPSSKYLGSIYYTSKSINILSVHNLAKTSMLEM